MSVRWLFIAVLLTACGKPPEPAPTGPPPVLLPRNYEWLNARRASKLITDTPGIGILDLREEEERNDGHGFIAGSISMPFSRVTREQLAGMDRNRVWLLYCAIGGRSELVAQRMARLDFKNVKLLRGGFSGWQLDGLPVDK